MPLPATGLLALRRCSKKVNCARTACGTPAQRETTCSGHTADAEKLLQIARAMALISRRAECWSTAALSPK